MNKTNMKRFLIALSLLFSLNSLIQAQAPSISYPTPQIFDLGVTITPLAPVNFGGPIPAMVPGSVTTLAGNGSYGFSNGLDLEASFHYPSGVGVDSKHNVYVADFDNNCIRKITPEGLVSTFVGNGNSGSLDGTGNAALFYHPASVELDDSDNVYVADMANHLIRKISPEGVVTTLAGSTYAGSSNGVGIAASFNTPTGIAVDRFGYVYVADFENNMIRKITPNGLVTTLAGDTIPGYSDGSGLNARFFHPAGVAVDDTGNVYVADADNNMIRKITPEGFVTTIAGTNTNGALDGIGDSARFFRPVGVALDVTGNVIVADGNNNMIRMITPAGIVSTLAGNTIAGFKDAIGTESRFSYPRDVVLDSNGTIYVAGGNNNSIRKITQSGYTIYPSLPASLNFDPTNGIISGTPIESSSAVTYVITGRNIEGSSTATLNITVNILSDIRILESVNIKIYPNPVFDCLNISNLPEGTSVYIFNAQGQMVNLSQSINSNQEIDMTSFAPGIYLIKLIGKEYEKIARIVKR